MRADHDELKVGALTLTGVASGGVMTSLFVPELDVLFDVGAVVSGAMRARDVLISHGHQDHLGQLPYMLSQRRMMGAHVPHVRVPEEILPPLSRILEAWREIEDFQIPFELSGHAPGDTVQLAKPELTATCVRSVHRVPSLCWTVHRTTHRLKPEYVGLHGAALKQLRELEQDITTPVVEPVISVSGDTQIELLEREPQLWRSRVLVLECTAWDERRTIEQTRAWGHIHVDELIPVVERFEGDALVLVHRSARHARSFARRVIDERFPASVRERVFAFGV